MFKNLLEDFHWPVLKWFINKKWSKRKPKQLQSKMSQLWYNIISLLKYSEALAVSKVLFFHEGTDC